MKICSKKDDQKFFGFAMEPAKNSESDDAVLLPETKNPYPSDEIKLPETIRVTMFSVDRRSSDNLNTIYNHTNTNDQNVLVWRSR